MLRLEKSRRDNEIYIRVRQSAKIFDRTFVLALLIAITIHLLAVFLFQIRLFVFGPENLLSTTKVDTHFVNEFNKEQETIVSVQGTQESKFFSQLLPPESSPTLPNLVFVHYIQTNPEVTLPEAYPFLEIEKDSDESHFTFLDFPFVAPKIKIDIKGPLADIPLQEFNYEMRSLFDLQTFSGKNVEQTRLVYNVQVDRKTGQIFWFQPQEISQDKSQNTIAEKILKNVRFQNHNEDFVQSGQVELTFISGKV